jgi:hypothetical protein
LALAVKKKNRVLKKNVYQKEMYAKGPRTTSSAWHGACGKKKQKHILKKNVYQKEMYTKGTRTTSSAWRLR